MNKRLRIITIIGLSSILVAWWAALFFTDTKEQQTNYLWQAGLAIITLICGVFGMLTSRHWSGLKSGVGRGVFFISLGLVTWGLGQSGWAYYTLKDATEVPENLILDIFYFVSIPLWTYGILQLSRATGAKFGLSKVAGKLIAIGLPIIIGVASYYFLVEVARGGSEYFTDNTFRSVFFDLGYAAGDAINLALALAIFGLSWNYLGGRFKLPIIAVLVSFGLLYLADFTFSYYDGKGEYYNGNWSDLLYLLVVTIFGLALCMLDPTRKKASTPPVVVPANESPGVT